MNTTTATKNTIVRLILRAASVSVVVALMGLQAAGAAQVTPPSVPGDLVVPAEHKAFKVGFAVGTQNYICLPTATGYAYTLFGPQATLYNDENDQIMTHYLSPNPIENGTARATWQHSNDTSSVWAMAVAISTDAAYVAPGAIPWLKLQVVGAQDGPNGGDKLSATTFIQRVNTMGGIAPATGCAASTDVGRKALVPYTTEYYFYKARTSTLE